MAAIYAGAFCLIALALEWLCAGGDIRSRLAQLRRPRFTPPLAVWVIIGAFYYLICFVLLYRLFALSTQSPFRNIALALVLTLMLVNAFWNYFFFRSRNLRHAARIGFLYTTIAIVLFLLLLRVDLRAAFWFAPYMIYLCYANVWGHFVLKLNRHD